MSITFIKLAQLHERVAYYSILFDFSFPPEDITLYPIPRSPLRYGPRTCWTTDHDAAYMDSGCGLRQNRFLPLPLCPGLRSPLFSISISTSQPHLHDSADTDALSNRRRLRGHTSRYRNLINKRGVSQASSLRIICFIHRTTFVYSSMNANTPMYTAIVALEWNRIINEQNMDLGCFPI